MYRQVRVLAQREGKQRRLSQCPSSCLVIREGSEPTVTSLIHEPVLSRLSCREQRLSTIRCLAFVPYTIEVGQRREFLRMLFGLCATWTSETRGLNGLRDEFGRQALPRH